MFVESKVILFQKQITSSRMETEVTVILQSPFIFCHTIPYGTPQHFSINFSLGIFQVCYSEKNGRHRHEGQYPSLKMSPRLSTLVNRRCGNSHW